MRVAAIRLSEDPEYLCEPGSVSYKDKCGKCLFGIFNNYFLSKRQIYNKTFLSI